MPDYTFAQATWIRRRKACALLGIQNTYFADLCREGKLIGRRDNTHPNQPWTAARLDSVLAYQSRRHRVKPKPNRCPRCQCVSPGGTLCDWCQKLDGHRYDHLRENSIHPAASIHGTTDLPVANN